MSKFKQDNSALTELDIFFALPSVIIGVAVLTLPAELAKATLFSDGWISIVIAGFFVIGLTMLAGKLASSFPHESFLSYSSKIVSKPVAYFITILLIIFFGLGEANIVRSLADISKEYMLENTRIEVLGLSFLLIIVYAVTGSRIGLFWLNMLFLPIILVSLFVVLFFNFPGIETENFFPLFKTDFKGYFQGTISSFSAFGGFSLILFYMQFVHKPKNVNKIVMYGISIPIIVYIVVFIFCIGVFGNITTENLIYPTIEIAKKSEFPGDIFKRVEALFFTIWIMSFFNTAAIIFDIVIVLLQSIFKKSNKIKLAFILSPIIFYISMFTETNYQFRTFVSIFDNVFSIFTILIIVMLFIIAKIRGVMKHEKT